MKKVLTIALSLIMVLCFIITATSCEEGYFDFLFDGEYTTYAPKETTEETTVTEATTTPAATTKATEATTTTEQKKQTTPLTLLADFDIVYGALVDSNNQVTVTKVGSPVIGETEVVYGGKSYTANAVQLSSSGYYICQFKNYNTVPGFKSMMMSGFTVEAFYIAGSASSVQGVVCGTEKGGWGLANRASGVPYFITGSGAFNKYNYVDAASAPSELTLVTAVYDFVGGQYRIYLNGVLSATKAINADYYQGDGDTFNRFCIGSDIKTGNVGGDFAAVGGITLVDAKLYVGCATTDQMAADLKATTDTFKEVAGSTDVPNAYVDLSFAGGTVTDKNGKVTVTYTGTPTVGTSTVSLSADTTGVTRPTVTTTANNYVNCTFNEITTSEEMKEFAQKGFTVETLYTISGTPTDIGQGIVCATEAGGWGIATNKGTLKPYLAYGNGTTKNAWLLVYGTTGVTSTEYIHVVSVYDYENKVLTIYINGVKSSSTAITSEFFPGAGDTFNRFCLGSDTKNGATGGDYSSTKSTVTIASAKIYDTALSSTQVGAEFEIVSDSLTPVPDAYVDLAFKGDGITDKNGKVTVTVTGAPTVSTSNVTLDATKTGTSLPTLTTSSGNYLTCQFNEITTSDAMKTFAQNGFTVETVYTLSGTPTDTTQGIVCATEFGGWGIANTKGTLKPYAVYGNGTTKNSWLLAYGKTGITSTEYIHVTSVYDFANKELVIYINGVKSASTAITSDFFPGTDGTFNCFCVGSDTVGASRAGTVDYTSKVANVTFASVKIYNSALSAAEVASEFSSVAATIGQ